MVLLNLGFRVFFLLAGVFAVVLVGMWAAYYFGYLTYPGGTFGVSAMTWHAHEMVYGYSAAVIAGFLLTAAKNWTGQPTAQGPVLFLLALLWLVARMAWLQGMMIVAAVTDMLFLLLLITALTRPIAQTKKWQHMAVISKVMLLLVLNALFYLGVFGYVADGVHLGVYGGLYLIIGLIQMMGRRLFPFFVALASKKQVELPNNAWLDRALLLLFLVFYIAELAKFPEWIGGYAALLIFVGSAMRLVRWYTQILWRQPLLWVLYIAMWAIALGFLLHFLVLYLTLSPFIALHAMAYGGVGLVSIGMMARVSLGHTGRDVYKPPAMLKLVFVLLVVGMIIRVLLPIVLPIQYLWWIAVSQLCWVLGFVFFLMLYAPMLVSPRVDGKAD